MTTGTYPSSDPAGGAPGRAPRSVGAHEAETDPHPQYLTQAEGDALYGGGGAFPGYGAASDLLDVTKAAESAGASALVARADHKHDVTTAAPGAIAFSDVAAEGTATTLARSDHKHSAPANPFPGYGTTSELVDVTKAAEAAGTSPLVARADHKHDITTATASTQAFGDAAAEGTATSLARSDHKHAIPANPVTAAAVTAVLDWGETADLATVDASVAVGGVLNEVARADHKHDVWSATAGTTITLGDSAAVGTSQQLARADHKHAIAGYGTTAEIADVTKAAESAGASSLIARADHKHDVSTATAIALTSSAASEGSATSLARSDHQHGMSKKRYRCTSNTAVSTVATAAITGFSAHALTAGKVYQIEAYIIYTTAAATTGPRPALVSSGGLTATDMVMVGYNRPTTTVVESTFVSALDTVLAFSGGIAAATVVLTASATIKVNVAGSIQLQMGSEVAASAITTLAGSWMTVEEVSE